MPEEVEHFRPWVQIAAFCQTAIQEVNGSLSLIRIVDRFAVAGQTPEMPPTNVQLTLVVILKSGFMRSRATITIRPNTPLGTSLPSVELPALFEGDDRGVAVVMPMGMLVKDEGVYWFDVLVDNELFSRIPLRVMYQRIVIGGQPPQPPTS